MTIITPKKEKFCFEIITVLGIIKPMLTSIENSVLSGHYLFIEASAPRRPNDRARLVSPVYQATATKCLNFWFSMYGSDIGHLRVFMQPQNGTAVRIWDLFGDQGSQDWKQGRVAYYSPTPFTVSALFNFYT